MNVSWIKVNAGGKLIAGASDCQITSKIIINLYGARTQANIMGTDPADGGTIKKRKIKRREIEEKKKKSEKKRMKNDY